MSRIAGLLVLPLVLALAAPVANAADFSGRKSSRGANGAHGSRGVDVVKSDCRSPVIETARYKEQVCRKGVAGYAYCRWVDREHDVRVPETCAPTITTEGTTPAKRGAFPPYPHG
ncbi:hypothetical protein [Methylopila sp. M107]|uniref:hypothetical protein n=1 Tax=Methylopila sp. M107 TaxID=1101190 RepID=UPI0003804E8F|nr:hypothetical protein [Methylopila sp. M107]